MTYRDTVGAFADIAAAKASMLRQTPLSFWVLTLKAGAFIGFGILLIFSVGQGVPAGVRPLVMGACFGIALTLVAFSGAELFTGHTMYMTIGCLTGRTTLQDLARCWAATWAGNLLGAWALAYLFVSAGGGAILHDASPSLLLSVAGKKASAPGGELFCRAVLCNWLVCLALWMAARTANDMAKCAVIFWCLLAFIAAGFEHSVANMTIFAIALLAQDSNTVTLAGALHNLTFVTLGNIAAGSLIMGGGYWLAAGQPDCRRPANTSALRSK